jgi:hypothetical protein
MRTQIIEVSPAVFSEIQEKAAVGAVEQLVWPSGSDSFALWMHETFGCVYHHEYKIVVRWEWGTTRKWNFPKGDES